MEEIWKPSVSRGFEKTHEVSNLGRVRRIVDMYRSPKAPFVYKINIGNMGYPMCFISNNDGRTLLLVAKEVLIIFKGAKSPVNITHKDGEKLNCSVDNLDFKERASNLETSTYTVNLEKKYPDRDCAQCTYYPCMADRNNKRFNHKTHFAADGCVNYKRK